MHSLHNSWYVAAWSRDLGVSTPFSIHILSQPLVLWRTPSGEVVALEDRCIHRMAPLSLGRCEGENLRCSYHGMLFDPRGTVIEIPCQDQIPARAKARAYAVVERYGWIWVWMGSADLADPARIPELIDLDTPDYHLGPSQYDFDVSAQLVRDNLLDFSHLPYLHGSSFGLSEAWARLQPRLITLDDGVRYERWVEGQIMDPSEGVLVDAWSKVEFRVPGFIMMWNASYPVGTAAALDFGPPPPELEVQGLYKTFTAQAVTPMSENSTRYFFSWGPHKNCGDEAVRDALVGMAAKAFTEDKLMVEAQRDRMRSAPDFPMLAIKSDIGMNIFNRILADRIEAEQLARDGR